MDNGAGQAIKSPDLQQNQRVNSNSNADQTVTTTSEKSTLVNSDDIVALPPRNGNNCRRHTISAYNPCWFCPIPGCSLRRNCIAIGIFEIVVWIVIIMVVTVILAEDIGSRTPPAARANEAYSLWFFVCCITLIGTSITAGIVILLAVRYRNIYLCIIHTFLNAITVQCLIILIVVDIQAKHYNNIASSLALILLYTYFGFCSYGLFTQIRAGVDIGLHYPRKGSKLNKPGGKNRIGNNSHDSNCSTLIFEGNSNMALPFTPKDRNTSMQNYKARSIKA